MFIKDTFNICNIYIHNLKKVPARIIGTEISYQGIENNSVQRNTSKNRKFISGDNITMQIFRPLSHIQLAHSFI